MAWRSLSLDSVAWGCPTLRSCRRGGEHRTIHSALDAGMTLLDAGDYYAAGHNELLIGEALRGRDAAASRLASSLGCSELRTGRSSVSTGGRRP